MGFEFMPTITRNIVGLFAWSIQKWLFWRIGFYLANQNNLKSFQKFLIGWKKAGPPKKNTCFHHVNRLTLARGRGNSKYLTTQPSQLCVNSGTLTYKNDNFRYRHSHYFCCKLFLSFQQYHIFWSNTFEFT